MKPAPELPVQIQNNVTAMFLMMPSTKNRTNGSTLLNKRASRALDKKYLCMTSPEPLVSQKCSR